MYARKMTTGKVSLCLLSHLICPLRKLPLMLGLIHGVVPIAVSIGIAI